MSFKPNLLEPPIFVMPTVNHKHRYKFLYSYVSLRAMDVVYVFECKTCYSEECEITKTDFYGR